MKMIKRLRIVLSVSLIALLAGCSTQQPTGANKREMTADASQALVDLYKSAPGARELGSTAKGVLVFPKVVKGGFVAAGQYGEGTLFEDGAAAGYYRTVAASWGLQAGLQKFGYALFFMTDDDLKYLDSSDGWELGVGPTITVLDQGMANAITTTTARKGVYVFFFDQRGLMAGVGVQGTKITKLDS